MIKLKPYEKRHEYTIDGQKFQKGFEELIIDLSLNAYTTNTIYIDTENDDISAMPSVKYKSVSNTYYGINVALFDWKVEGIRSVAVNAFDYNELEEYISEKEIKELRRQFEEENNYDKNFYKDKEEFYEDFATDYVDFLLNAENKGIDKYVKDELKDTVDYYKEKFDETYYELLENEIVEDLQDE